MRARLIVPIIIAGFIVTAPPARAQSAFPQGSVSPDLAEQSFGSDEDAKSGSNGGFDRPDSDASTNYQPPATPYTGQTYGNSGEVCVTCKDDDDSDTSAKDEDDSGGGGNDD